MDIFLPHSLAMHLYVYDSRYLLSYSYRYFLSASTTPFMPAETISSSYLVNTVLGQFPVLNSMTIYSAYVCAQTGDLVAITQNND